MFQAACCLLLPLAQVVYPDVRTKLPNGEAVADHALDEHQELKELLYRLDGMDDPNHAEFDQLMRHISKVGSSRAAVMADHQCVVVPVA